METETIEYKKSLTQLKKGIISIVAILNKHKKGKIIFGIKDNGEVIGIDIGKNTLRNISKTISETIESKIYPIIKEEIIENKTCVSIEFKGDLVPYFAYGRAYLRVSDEDRLISKAELEKMILDNNKIQWDKQTKNNFSLNDISDLKLKNYVNDIGLKYTNKKEVLEKLNLVIENKLTNASIILFGENVEKYFRLLNLRCAVFPGLDKSQNYIDAKDFYGDLFELINYAEKYILEHINIGMKLDGLKRVDIPEINKDAFREAIINAFCHRDYFINQEVQIAIFKDRVEILNPGELFDNLTIKEIIEKRVSKRRNQLIADIFHRIHLVEKWGTGIKKIKSLEPKTNFEVFTGFFMTTFRRENVPETTPQTTLQTTPQTIKEIKLTNLELEILDLIKKNNEISKKEIAEKLKKSPDTIKEYLARLKRKKVLKREGTYKGRWIVEK